VQYEVAQPSAAKKIVHLAEIETSRRISSRSAFFVRTPSLRKLLFGMTTKLL
jgi:hypothetical protein